MTDQDESGTAAEDTTVPWQRLRPESRKITALLMLGVSAVAGVPTATGIASGTSWPLALGVVVAGALVLIATVTAFDALRLRVTRFRVTDTRLEMITGIVFKQHRSLARERIRSVDLSAHPLLRMFGVVKVKVGTGETGSGSGSTSTQTLTLDPVDLDQAHQLRAELLRRGDAEAETTGEQRLATWRLGWLRYAPLSVLTPALAAAAVGVIFQVAGWLGHGGLPVEIVTDLVRRHGPWIVLLAGLASLLVLGVVASLGLQGEAWWNHRLDREPGGTLRVRRGLLINRSLSLEEERVRGVEIVEPLGVRAAGAARLDVIAIGLRNNQGNDLTVLVPAAPRATTMTAAGAVIGSTATELVAHPRAARGRRLRRAGVVVAGCAAITTLVHLLWPVSAFVSVLIGLTALVVSGTAVWIAWDSAAALGHGFNRGYLVTRRGSIRRATAHLDRAGVIGWRIRQSVFQRRLGLVTLDATTAAGKGHYAAIDADQSEILDFADQAVPGLLAPFLVRDSDSDLNHTVRTSSPDGAGGGGVPSPNGRPPSSSRP